MIPHHQKLYTALKLTGNDIASVVEGGLFNDVHRVIKSEEHFYIKSFADEAKTEGFPPLPTTALQRYKVAVDLHEHAQQIVRGKVYVPRLLAADPDNRAIAMEGAKGVNLYEYVVNKETFHYAVEQVSQVLTWLSSLHALENSNILSISANSDAFKHYKATLQYQKTFEFLFKKNLKAADAFVNEHLTLQETLLHGDLNTRNIIICEDGRIAVIDFEQGQVGCGSHDAAYLISELIIASFDVNEEIETLIDFLWSCYETKAISIDKHKRFRRHLCFQVLYRLKGPSRHIWTGHLNDDIKAKIEAWCVREFSNRL
ncbi:tRNA A-37 threonylcarbamoyl transferase component Bud32 [Pseudomonas lini]|uniref:phosphotransferase n=1 Tax=Pseudomonas lini TaxID=163011 RepID=UPI00277FB304|nr:phosphotransferase [Pseudomonas lini]MDQ0122883.1 tRNA A-37 threonylcarbamoyl transferase component Bud32 [Pseudomonas lini]